MSAMIFNTPEAIATLTRENPFERSSDGRPRVPDDLIERMKLVTTEEAWSVLRKHGYHLQFEGNWLNLHPKQVLVGRAVTAAFVPARPDFHALIEERGRSEGRVGGQNSWVIDTLVENDVLVVDLFGKIRDGTFAGDNLATAIQAKSRTGMVIHGGIRDLQRVLDLPDFAVFVRGVDPSAIADVTLSGVNVPIRIGDATVLPGDVVLGTESGVIFIPPGLVQEVVEYSEDTRLRDAFGKQRIAESVYTPGEIDVPVWIDSIEADYQRWRQEREREL
jgi:4-hydroxy-4-methyl-2-oxoglutarate aldolase